MARMIPSIVDPNAAPGEIDVFNGISGAPDDWVVIHSLDLAPWNRGLRTEIDFLVIVPHVGILCIEVKSHPRISVEDGVWIPGSIKRSPFKQALDARYTFFRRLAELAPQFRSIPVTHCCIFPRAVFRLSKNMGVSPWELIDSDGFKKLIASGALSNSLLERMNASISADSRLRPLVSKLNASQIDTIVGHCIPVQRFRPTARNEIEQREAQALDALVEQQRPVVLLSALNSRLIVSGAAGTGKTLIALELGRRLAADGKRVAIVCYNRLIARWMREQVCDAPPGLLVNTAQSLMAMMLSIQIPETADKRFWEHDLPDALEERLTDPEFSSVALFDYLIVDEAQDLLARPRVWQVLMSLLEGGIKNGRYAIFGDFAHQALTRRETMTANLQSLDLEARPARWNLSQNCRNYRVIGDTAVRLAGLTVDVYSGYLRRGGTVDNYNIHFYSSDEEQLNHLEVALAEVKRSGYKPNEITVLSFAGGQSPIASKASPNLRLSPPHSPSIHVTCCSVHLFKGMENKVIIVTDVSLESDAIYQRDLLYTAITRATEAVIVLCSCSSQFKLQQWIKEGITNARQSRTGSLDPK